jgi:cyclic pyranopterin phosphate synthase
MDLIKDKFERIIDYMRISVTDRCNLRCIFCMPAGGMKFIEFPKILSPRRRLSRIVRTAAGLE